MTPKTKPQLIGILNISEDEFNSIVDKSISEKDNGLYDAMDSTLIYFFPCKLSLGTTSETTLYMLSNLQSYPTSVSNYPDQNMS